MAAEQDKQQNLNTDDHHHSLSVQLAAQERRKNNNLPNFLSSVNFKHVKLGYHYLISRGLYFLLAPLLAIFFVYLSTLTIEDLIQLRENLEFDMSAITLCSTFIIYLTTLYLMRRPRDVYLVNYACYKPVPSMTCSKELYMEKAKLYGSFSEESLTFQKKILERSGIGQRTYLPGVFFQMPPDPCMAEARKEAEMVIFGAINEVLAKTGVKPEELGILVVNSGVFNPTPSLCTMIVHRYKLGENVLSYNLSAMGCSAGLLSIDLAKQILQVHPNSYALVVSTENITVNGYMGNDRTMLVTNCLFRLGGAAVLLSNRSLDRRRSKYQLIHLVRTHNAAIDKCFNCIMQRQDESKNVGYSLSKDLPSVAAETLLTNLMTLGPLVLPISEKLLFFATSVGRKIFKMNIEPYKPDFKLAFEHFCLHPGGRAVLDKLEKNIGLTNWHVEPSRMTLYRFGNTSSSSLWYELAYFEAKGRIKKGDRTWQISFGSGFKCNSAVWRALKTINPAIEKNPWMDEIHEFPIHVPKVASVVS